MTPDPDAPGPTTADQRRTERHPVERPFRLVLEAQAVEGETENLSEAGALLSTAGSLRVTVRVEGGEERSARLVRLQRMGDGSTGIAVEFDERG